MKKVVVKSQWDEKFIREQPFMAFGTLIHGYARINQGKGMTLEAFKVAADALFKKAQDYAIEAYNSVNKDDDVDIPTKKKTTKK